MGIFNREIRGIREKGKGKDGFNRKEQRGGTATKNEDREFKPRSKPNTRKGKRGE
jgi:hypothetical protein